MRMRATRAVILVAVIATFALVNYEMSAQSSTFEEANKLKPADTSAALSPTDAVQHNRTRLLRAANITAAPIAEERAPKQVLLARGEPKAAEIARANLAAQAVRMKNALPHALPHAPPKIREKKLLEMITPYCYDLVPKATILKRAHERFQDLTPEEVNFVKVQISSLTTSIEQMKKTIERCVEIPVSERKTIEMIQGSREQLDDGQQAFVTKYYKEYFNKKMDELVYKLREEGLSEAQIHEKFWVEDLGGRLRRPLIKFYSQQWEKAKLEPLMEKAESCFAYGRTPSETYEELAKSDPKHKEVIGLAIEEWFKKNDADMFKILEEWTSMDKNPSIVHELLKAHQLNPQMSFNTRRGSSFDQMTFDQEMQARNLFKKWLKESLSPFEADKQLGIMHAAKGSQNILVSDAYKNIYKKAEIDLVRMLATSWKQNWTPNDVEARLAAVGLEYGQGMKHEFCLMYTNWWNVKNSQSEDQIRATLGSVNEKK